MRGRTVGPGVLAVLAAVFTACGGSGAGTPGAVEPAAYMRSVCGALVEWNEGVGTAFAETDARPDSDRPADIRRDMLDFFDALQDTTDAMRSRIERAGAPEGPEGAAAATALRDALVKASDTLKSNRARFAAIPLSDVQPAASIEGAMTVVGEQLEAVQASVRLPESRFPALRQARESEPECKRLAEQQ